MRVFLTCGVIVVLFVVILAIIGFSSYHQAKAGSSAGPDNAAWWSDQTAGLIGAIGGTLIGVLGGLVGILTSMGKAHRFVIGLTRGLTAFGVISMIFGLVALVKGQPYAVYYPTLLGGFVTALAIGLNIITIEARYRELELRKMAIQDATDEGRCGG